MQTIKINGLRIEAVYTCLPDRKLDNIDFLKELYGEGSENVVRATGFESRYIVSPGISSLDLCCKAAECLIADASIDIDQIGAVVFVTFTPEYSMPFNAAAVQERLGLKKDVLAFDMSLACSGYGYGLYNAGLIAKSIGKKVLLLDGDVQSAFISNYDKATIPVMADAGTATLISCSHTNEEWVFSFYTDGSGRKSLYIPSGGSLSPVTPKDHEYLDYDDGSKRRNIDIFMDGFAIFKFVVKDVNHFIKEFLKETEQLAEIDAFVPHQANMYMIKQLAKSLGISSEKVWISGNKYGNSASATVPVTISDNANEKLIKENNRILISGFGGGLSASVGLITLQKNAYYKIFQYEKDGIK